MDKGMAIIDDKCIARWAPMLCVPIARLAVFILALFVLANASPSKAANPCAGAITYLYEAVSRYEKDDATYRLPESYTTLRDTVAPLLYDPPLSRVPLYGPAMSQCAKQIQRAGRCRRRER